MANPIPMVYQVTAGTLTYGEAQSAVGFVTPSTAQDTANAVTLDFAGILTGPVDFAVATVMNSSGLVRTPGTITWSGTIVTVTESNIASTDQIVIQAFASPLK